MQFNLQLNNFPDCAVLMTKFIPIFSVPDAYNIEDVNLFTDFFAVWKKINNSDYQVEVNIQGTATVEGGSVNIPLIVNLDMVIVNERNYYPVQTEGF